MGQLRADQVRDTNTDIGDIVKLVDVGGAAPGLPALDGSLLTDVVGGVAGVVLLKQDGSKLAYDTITDAVAVAVSGDTIAVGPGMYAESVTLPDGVYLTGGSGPFQTVIAGALLTGTRVTMGDGCVLADVTVLLPTDAVPAIDCSPGVGEVVTLLNLVLVGQGGSGIGIRLNGPGDADVTETSYAQGNCDVVFEVVAGRLGIRRSAVLSGTVGTVAKATGGVLLAGNFAVTQEAVVTDVFAVGAAAMTVQQANIQSGTNGIHVTSDSAVVTLSALFMTEDLPVHVLADPALTVADFSWQLGSANQSKIIASGAWISSVNLRTSYSDNRRGIEGFAIWGEFSVGRPEGAGEVSIGEGNTYTRGMVVLTTDNTAGGQNDGSNFIDVSANAADADGPTVSFQDRGINHSILFGSSLENASDVLKHWGIKVQVQTGAVEAVGFPRSFTFEIWNGTHWVAVGSMATHATLFHRYASHLFLRSGSLEHVRLGIDHDTPWVKKTIDGRDLYWSRVRINTTLTTAPVFEQFRLAGSQADINGDGTMTFHGRSRFRQTIVGTGNIFGESGGVTDFDSEVGSIGFFLTGWNHHVKNSLMNNERDAIYTQFAIPNGLDTSFPLQIGVYYEVDSTGPTNDARMLCSVQPIEVVGVLVADPAGGIEPVTRAVADAAAINAESAQSVLTPSTIQTDTAKKVFLLRFGPYDLSRYYEDDYVAVRIELDSDGTDNINLRVWGVELDAVKWTHGNKL